MTEEFKKRLREGKTLTKEEVQQLRDKANEYRKQGGNYLEGMEAK